MEKWVCNPFCPSQCLSKIKGAARQCYGVTVARCEQAFSVRLRIRVCHRLCHRVKGNRPTEWVEMVTDTDMEMVTEMVSVNRPLLILF